MKADISQWRCMCGNENPVKTVDCHKCKKQRWSQLGFSRMDATIVAYSIGLREPITGVAA